MRAVDVGTTKVLAAVPTETGTIAFRRERNAFLDLKRSDTTRGVLERLGVKYEEPDGRLHVVGDAAFTLAQVFDKDTRRPMRDGLISPAEESALTVLEVLIGRVMGPAPVPGMPCGFTVPAEPVDRDADILYQAGALEKILRGLGYAPVAVREGLAVVLAELEETDFSGIGISCGGGMVNVSVAYKGVEAVGFSSTRGGDWIDRRVAQSLGYVPPEITAIRESGIDLRKPEGRIGEALSIYYRHLIRYTVEKVMEAFYRLDAVPAFGGPIPVAVAGGTCLAEGFVEILAEEMEAAKMPVDVAWMRRARDPLTSAVRGCLKMVAEFVTQKG